MTKNNGRLINSDLEIEETYTMRNMEKKDIQKIMELQKRVLFANSFELEWFCPFVEDELDELIGEGNNIAIGIFVDGKLAAFRLGCSFGSEYEEITKALGGRHMEKPCFLMNGVFVEKAYRGNRLQQMMTEHCIEECRKKGIHIFLSVVHPDNIPSIQSLMNIGFKERARQMIFEGKYDRLILVKEDH